MLRLRLLALACPPLGLALLWRQPGLGLGRRIFASVGILLYCIPYAALVIFLLARFAGLEVEWRGGFPPVLTWHKTLPNYAALEASRQKQINAPSAAAPTAAAPATVAGAPVKQDDPAPWPGFRGPNRDGRSLDKGIATNWPAGGLTPLWKQPVGGGYASFAIAGGRAFTIEQRRDDEAVTAYDMASGRELWNQTYPARFDESMGGEGPRATPSYDDGKVYSQGAMGNLLCLDAATGKVLWKVDILTDNRGELLRWGTASSPLIVNDKVVVEAGGPAGHSIAAYDKLTGRPLWHSLDDPASYSSAELATLAGQEQILAVTESRAVGLNPATGALLWSWPWRVKMGNRNIAQPVLLSSNRFMLSAGYGTGCEAVELTAAASGLSARSVWRTTALKNKFTSSVFDHGFVYGLDEDLLVCVDAATGERRWKDGRYGYGQLVWVDGYLVILGGEGQLALVRATPDVYDERAHFQAIEGKTWNHPAVADGKILVRNAVQMACFNLRPEPAQTKP